MHFHRRRLSLSPVPVPYRFLSRRRLHRRMVLELPVFMGTTSDRPVASTFGKGAAFPAYLANARGLVPDVVDRSPHLRRRLASQVNRQVPEFLLDMEDAKPVSLIRGLSADLRFQPLEQPLGQPRQPVMISMPQRASGSASIVWSGFDGQRISDSASG
jgi:hypothetical protein